MLATTGVAYKKTYMPGMYDKRKFKGNQDFFKANFVLNLKKWVIWQADDISQHMGVSPPELLQACYFLFLSKEAILVHDYLDIFEAEVSREFTESTEVNTYIKAQRSAWGGRGHSHVSADIICLSNDPHFLRKP